MIALLNEILEHLSFWFPALRTRNFFFKKQTKNDWKTKKITIFYNLSLQPLSLPYLPRLAAFSADT